MKRGKVTSTAWAILWRSRNALDGEGTHLIYGGGVPLLFSTRAEARGYIAIDDDYIRIRPDLKGEPHGWKMPKAVRVTVEVIP